MAKAIEKRLRALETLPAARRPGVAKYEPTPDEAGEIFDILVSAGAIEAVMRAQLGDELYEQTIAGKAPESA